MYIDDLFNKCIHGNDYMTIVDVIYKVSFVNIKLCIIVNNILKLMWYVGCCFANLYLLMRFTCRAHMSILYGQIQNLFRIRDMVNWIKLVLYTDKLYVIVVINQFNKSIDFL